jgi:hypothetical protein
MKQFLTGSFCALLLTLLLPVGGRAEESKDNGLETADTAWVNLENGSKYMKHLPKGFKNDGSWGAFLLLSGQCSDVDGMLNAFTHGLDGSSFFESKKYISILPAISEGFWTKSDSTPMLALLDALATHKIDKSRIHIVGASSGGFLSAWLGYERPDLFATVTVIAASLALVDKDALKKSHSRPVFMIIGDSDSNLKIAKADHARLVKSGNRYARLSIVEGEGHQVRFWRNLDRLGGYYEAVESGYDYPGQLDKARKLLPVNLDESVKVIREISLKPYEEGFFAELMELRTTANTKAEIRLRGILSKFKSNPAELKKQLEQFEGQFEGFPVASTAREQLLLISDDKKEANSEGKAE